MGDFAAILVEGYCLKIRTRRRFSEIGDGLDGDVRRLNVHGHIQDTKPLTITTGPDSRFFDREHGYTLQLSPQHRYPCAFETNAVKVRIDQAGCTGCEFASAGPNGCHEYKQA